MKLNLCSVTSFHVASFGCSGHLSSPPLQSSISVCTLTHSSLPWSSASLGLAPGFEVIVKTLGHTEGRGVIMRSSPQLLLPNLPSSPFVSLRLHFLATHLFSSFLYCCLFSTFSCSSLPAHIFHFSFFVSHLLLNL